MTISPSPAPKTQHRILELDALRGIAALAVVLFHYTTRFDQLFGRSEPLAVSLLWGGRGVDLFFMLSGFVILLTLDRTKTVGEFLIGRCSRLFPAFWAAAILTYLVVRWAELPDQVVSPRDALLNLTMVPLLLNAEPINCAYWTLQAELLFYVAMLLLHRAGAFRRVPLTLGIWLGLAAAAHFIFWWGANSPLIASLIPKLQTITSLKFIQLFAIGITFYDVRRSGWTKSHVAILGFCVAITAGIEPWPRTVIMVALAGLLLAAVNGRLSVLAAWPLVHLGAISYTLYLVHENIGFVALLWLQQIGCEPHLAVLLTIGGAIGLATLLSLLIERPALRILRTQQKRRPPATIQAGTLSHSLAKLD